MSDVPKNATPSLSAEAQKKLQALQADLSKIVESRQKLGAQLAENESVRKEFVQLNASNTIYKLVGGVLLKQDQDEAKANVAKRISYIESEIARMESKLKEVDNQRTQLLRQHAGSDVV